MELTFPRYLFDAATLNPDNLQQTSPESVDEEADKKLRCRICEQIVTDEGQRIAVAGQHRHVRTNPSGMEYDFGCFQQAPGCAGIGESSPEHTWFAGHQWQIGICTGCGEHLGWLFKGEGTFYGLIIDRLLAGSG